jgi:hypothetical protein
VRQKIVKPIKVYYYFTKIEGLAFSGGKLWKFVIMEIFLEINILSDGKKEFSRGGQLRNKSLKL